MIDKKEFPFVFAPFALNRTVIEMTQQRNEIVERIRSEHSKLITQFDVSSIAIFGSASRNELSAESDVDVLVHFNGPATFEGYFRLKFYLEELLGRKVDLATDRMIKPRLQKRIADELLYVT
jgi:predicted nucleotidyltransferase